MTDGITEAAHISGHHPDRELRGAEAQAWMAYMEHGPLRDLLVRVVVAQQWTVAIAVLEGFGSDVDAFPAVEASRIGSWNARSELWVDIGERVGCLPCAVDVIDEMLGVR